VRKDTVQSFPPSRPSRPLRYLRVLTKGENEILSPSFSANPAGVAALHCNQL
jgi:hypothetical protein